MSNFDEYKASLPKVKFSCGPDWQNRNRGLMIGIHWAKNDEAVVGEYIYLRSIELTFYMPLKFNWRNFK